MSLSRVPNSTGFSLIEVLITLAIISILTALVMVRYGSFNSAVLLKNQAFEIALDLREAQVFSISVRSDQQNFREEYGLFFNDGAGKGRYVFWQDSAVDTPAAYNTGEAVNTILLDSRFEINNIYTDCPGTDYVGCGEPNSLSISFARPNFDASIIKGNGTVANSAYIVISPVGEPTLTRAIYVNTTALITVE